MSGNSFAPFARCSLLTLLGKVGILFCVRKRSEVLNSRFLLKNVIIIFCWLNNYAYLCSVITIYLLYSEQTETPIALAAMKDYCFENRIVKHALLLLLIVRT